MSHRPLHAQWPATASLQGRGQACARMWAAFFLYIVMLCLAEPAQSATPIGTVISNTARVDYVTNGIRQSRLASNTDFFRVEGVGYSNTAQVTLTRIPALGTPAAGDTVQYTADIFNNSDDTLANAALEISAPAGSAVKVGNASLTPVGDAGTARFLVPVADVRSFERTSATFSLTLPLDIAPGAAQLVIDYRANATSISRNVTALQVTARTRAVIELLQYDARSQMPPLVINTTGYRDVSGGVVPLAPPTIPGSQDLVTSHPLPLSPATMISHGQTLFVRVADADHNQDPETIDTVDISLNISENSERETLHLRETSINSGIFTGYVRIARSTMKSSNGILDVSDESHLNVGYTDAIDSRDSMMQMVLVDPYGRLFDSQTGGMLDGYTVHLINATTGQPAVVYGDDGVSRYPDTVVSGAAVTDAGGNAYPAKPGHYRFPFVEPGQYQLLVVAPSGAAYRWPSQADNASLNSLPGVPFMVDIGSRGETFEVVAGPPLHLDIPLDPLTTQLFVRRSTSKDEVAPGDYMQFKVKVENASSPPIGINSAVISDTLPQGLRYRRDTLYINGTKSAEPVIGDDGHSLRIDAGLLAAATTTEITYVVEAGAIRPGTVESTSRAEGNGGAIRSNESRVSTRVTEDLLRSRNILVGRVIAHDDQGKASGEGLAGVRVYMEDGSYAVTDAKGQYHFVGVLPGTHVVQLDLDSLPPTYEPLAFEKNTRFAGRAWSQFVDLQGGTLWRADFHAALRAKPAGNLEMVLDNDGAATPEGITYRLKITNRSVPVSRLRATLMLPEGARYVAGSSRLAGQAIADPSVDDNVLGYGLPDLTGDWIGDLTLQVAFDKPQAGQRIAKAMVTFDAPEAKNQRAGILEHKITVDIMEAGRQVRDFTLRPNFDTLSAELDEADRQALDQLAASLKGLHNARLTAIGHSDNKVIRRRSRDRFSDNQYLSEQRALAVANYLRDALGLTPAQITVSGRGDSEPLIGNKTAEGRALNRRVELRVSAEQVETRTTVAQPHNISAPQSVPTVGKRPGEKLAAKADAGTDKPKAKVVYDETWLATAKPGLEWISPAAGELPHIPVTTVAVKHDIHHTVEVLLEGEPVPAVNYDGMAKTPVGLALSRWTGVPLKEGDNHFVAIIRDRDGNETERLSRTVHHSSPPIRAELVKDKSVLTADGITQPVIALRLTDRDGFPARREVIGDYLINAPYRAALNTAFNPAVLPGSPQVKTTYTIGEDGIALIRLEPTTTSGEVRLTLPLVTGETVITANLAGVARDWIVVGFAEGSTGYQTLKGHTENLPLPASQDGLYSDGKIAFFAKGQVLGKWLLTTAYDSNKQKLKQDPKLFQTIDPNAYYTVYGDASQPRYDAASRDKLFLKLERDQFYALYGDYTTALNNTKLSTYNRAVTGLKSRYHDERYDIVLFETTSNQAFHRDDIRGKGVVGPYALSRQAIVINSEVITIETRDRFHPERVLKTQPLARFTDYDIDYVKGAVTLREPLSLTDADLNPLYLVVKFESLSAQDTRRTVGGRIESKLTDGVTAGVTHVDEGRVGGDARLTGADVKVEVDKNTVLRTEVASSRDERKEQTGQAMLAEIERKGEQWNGKVYARQADAGFGIGQGSGVEIGTRKIGAEASVRVDKQLTIKGQVYQQDNLVTHAQRDLIEAQGNLQLDKDTVRLGLRSVRDERGDGLREGTDSINAGISHRMLEDKITLRVDREQAIGSASSVDFPSITRLGTDYRLNEQTTLFAQEDITDGKQRDTRTSQLGLKTRPWEGGEAAATVKQKAGTDGGDTAGNVALRQRWKLTKEWSLDLSAEQNKTLGTVAPLNTNQPFVNGASSDFSAQSVGLSYTPGPWTWQSRLEHRDASADETWNLSTSLASNPTSALGLIGSLRLSDTRAATGQHRSSENARLDVAWRQPDSAWTALDRLELKHETSSGELGFRNWRLINNLNTNYRVEHWQLALQYGIKYVTETIDGNDYSGVTDLLGIETRYDLTPKWDIGAQLSTLHNWHSRQQDYAAGLSIGHSFMDNVWLSVGYNFIGFLDRDFVAARNSGQGFFLRFRVKFDQVSIKEALKWANQ